MVRKIADYQFGRSAGERLFPENVIFKISKKTGRIRQIWDGGVLIATLNPTSGFLNLTIEGAERLVENGKAISRWVKVRDDAAVFVEKGKNVFAKHVVDVDREIRPMEEVLVLNSRGEVIAVGKAILSGVEMLEFTWGVAVKVRRGKIGKTKKGKRTKKIIGGDCSEKNKPKGSAENDATHGFKHDPTRNRRGHHKNQG